MKNEFSADFFRRNRERLRTLFSGRAPIVISANARLQRSADAAYPFSQDKSFWYLTGLNEPSATLVLDNGKEYLILPPPSEVQDIFDGQVNNAELSRISAIDDIYSYDNGWKILASRLKRAKHVATLNPAPAYIDTYGMYANPARRYLLRQIMGYNPDLEILDISDHLVRMRSRKQPLEIAAIERAIKITTQAIKTLTTPKKLQKYDYAFQLEADISRSFAKNNSGHAFDPIITSGQDSCVLHNGDHSLPLRQAQLVQLDIGAEVNGYAADISRSRSKTEPSRRQLAIFEAVKEVQDYALSLLKPGVVLVDYEKQIEQFMGEKLRELLLIKTINSQNVRQFFPHATSHFLGLDTHDVGDYQRPLEPGHIVTCEPGIYVKAESIGIRLEDDILITKDGHRNLSAGLSRDLL